MQVNVSAQLVAVRAESPNDSRRSSLVLPAADETSMSVDDSSNLLPAPIAPPSISHEWEIQIEVVDEGIGVSAAEIGNLFQSFRQARKVQMVFGGTGLGLAISRSVNMSLFPVWTQCFRCVATHGIGGGSACSAFDGPSRAALHCFFFVCFCFVSDTSLSVCVSMCVCSL